MLEGAQGCTQGSSWAIGGSSGGPPEELERAWGAVSKIEGWRTKTGSGTGGGGGEGGDGGGGEGGCGGGGGGDGGGGELCGGGACGGSGGCIFITSVVGSDARAASFWLLVCVQSSRRMPGSRVERGCE